jgi:hypothetical protein
MATTPKISPERTKQQSLAYGRNLVVFALLILLPGLWGAIHGARTLRWPRADATIIDANLRTFTRESSDTRYRDEWHSFAVHYSYKVGGIDYFGGRVEPYDFGMQNSAGAQRMRDRHPVGSVAKIAYDPANANVAYLEPGASSFSLAMVGIGLVIGASGLWVRSLARRGIGRMET